MTRPEGAFDATVYEYVPRTRKRSKVEIYYDILTALRDEASTRSRISVTRVAGRVNISYDRFMDNIKFLVKIGFCRRGARGYLVAERGLEFLEKYDRFNESLRELGLYP